MTHGRMRRRQLRRARAVRHCLDRYHRQLEIEEELDQLFFARSVKSRQGRETPRDQYFIDVFWVLFLKLAHCPFDVTIDFVHEARYGQLTINSFLLCDYVVTL